MSALLSPQSICRLPVRQGKDFQALVCVSSHIFVLRCPIGLTNEKKRFVILWRRLLCYPVKSVSGLLIMYLYLVYPNISV